MSKSTIQKYATRHGWAKEREQYCDEATENFMRTRQYDIDEINSQHIKIYRTMQIIGYNLLVRATKEISLGNLKNGASILKCASNVISHGIKGERKILGLSTRPKKVKTNTQNEKDLTPWLDLFNNVNKKA